MKAVVQRVSKASVTVDKKEVGNIHKGLLIFLGITHSDTKDDEEWLAKKIAHLRIFSDENGIMNKSVKEVGGEVLVVSQFTLHASTKKGNRPSYIAAAKPEMALKAYQSFVNTLATILQQPIATGTFGADMKVSLLNDGPVTLIIDTQDKK